MTSNASHSPASTTASTNVSIDTEAAKESMTDREDTRPSMPSTNEKSSPDTNIVDFDGPDDPLRPMNWSLRKKIYHTLLYGLTTTWITFASAVYSAGLEGIVREFHVSSETAAAGVSLLVFGFAVGPLVWAPLSEMYGRKWVVLTPYFIAMIFSFGSATAKDIQTLLITRFFAGVFGSAPVTNTGGVIADIWAPKQRGLAIVGYGLCICGGPAFGPVIGSALSSTSSLGWRWTEYITGIVMAAQLLVDVLVLEESYAPTLLVSKAHRLRFETKNWALHAKHEEWDPSLKEFCDKYLVRPFQMLATPICLFMCLYAAFVYGILYASLEGFQVVFRENRKWAPVPASLPFLALLLGMIFGAALNVVNNKYYAAKLVANHGRAVPEARLPPMMVGGIFFTAGMFIFAWTSNPSINYWPSLVGIALTGLGFVSTFQAALNYLIDAFTRYSASAIAANTFLRSAFAGAFPLFILPLYHSIGVDYGTTIFACIAAALIPVPFLFAIYGRKIRAMGKWSAQTTQ